MGNFAKQSAKQVVVGTKFFTIPWVWLSSPLQSVAIVYRAVYPWQSVIESYTALQTNFLVGGGFRLGRQSMIKALRASLERLGQQKTDLYQV